MEGQEGLESPPATPSQHLCKTSLQELTPLRIATGNSHLDSLGFESAIQIKNPPFGGSLVWRARRGSTDFQPARNFIFESLAFKRKFPCNMPLAYFTSTPYGCLGFERTEPLPNKKLPKREFLAWSDFTRSLEPILTDNHRKNQAPPPSTAKPCCAPPEKAFAFLRFPPPNF